MRIGLISDTHDYLHPRIPYFFKNCNQIWHAGDIGQPAVIEKLEQIAPTKAVFGNIDSQELQQSFPKHLHFNAEGLKVYITHIGGYPGRYNAEALQEITKNKPNLFICGHSHILKIMPDKVRNLLHINPGAAGYHGWHKVMTVVRFEINSGRILNPEVIELGQRKQV